MRKISPDNFSYKRKSLPAKISSNSLRFEWRENTAFRLLALFLAIVLWIYVTHQKNPVLERAARVTLNQRGLPANMVIRDMPSTVTVYYKTSKGRLALLGAGDFKATINLAGVGSGRHSLPVEVQAPSGVSVVRVIPKRVTVTLDRLTEKNVPVKVNVLGTPAPGYRQLEPVVEPPVIKVAGAEHLLEDIKKVSVTVDIRGMSTGVEQVLPVSAGVKGVELHPASVKVTVPVEPLPTRAVKVEPFLEGEPARGFRVENVIVEPDTVQVAGPGDLLEGIQGLKTEILNISGADSPVTRRVSVIVPEGISLVTPREVQVTVGIVPGDSSNGGGGVTEPAPPRGE